MIFSEYIKDICRIFSKEYKLKEESNNNQDDSFFNSCNSIIIDGLNKYEIEYLRKLNGKKEDDILDEYWDIVLKDRSRVKKKIMNMDLLRLPTIEESLNLITVVNLKDILRRNNLKVSGKKNELIGRLLVNLNEKDIKLYLEKNVYVISDKGLSIIKRYADELDKYKEEHILEMSRLIKNSKYEEAFHKDWDFSSFTDIYEDIRNNNEVIEKPKIFYSEEIKTIFREIDWLKLDDLDNTEEYKELFKDALRYSCISGNGYINASDVVSFLNILTEETFKSRKLEDFLQNNEVYLAKLHAYKNHINIYVYTIESLIRNNIELRELKTDTNNRSYVRGIEILGCNNYNSCDICRNHKNKIAWNELHKLPVLPAHYGCRCSYIAWIKNED